MVVRMRHTRAHTANRRSHHALTGPRLSRCSNCGAMGLRHRVCASCGQYRGRTVIDTGAAAIKKAKKKEVRASAGAAPSEKK